MLDGLTDDNFKLKEGSDMNRFLTALGASVFALNVSAGNIFSDDFESYDNAGATIAPWKYYDNSYTDANCTAGKTGFGPGTVDNRNFTTVTAGGGEYFRAGLEKNNDNTISGTQSLAVYQNFYATAACVQILVFREFSTGFSAGAHRLSAQIRKIQYSKAYDASAKAGIFVKILDVSNGYSETLVSYEPRSYFDTPSDVILDFTVPEGLAADDILQVGFYAQGPNNQGAGAIWDNVSLDTYTAPVAGALGPSSPIPTLPLGGLFALVGLMAWLGLRKRA